MDTADLQTPLAHARALAGDIAAASDEIEQTRRIPAALLDKLHEARLCRMLLPPLGRRGRDRSRRLSPNHRRNFTVRRVSRLEPVRCQQRGPAGPASRTRNRADDFQRSTRARRLGSAERTCRNGRRRRLPREWPLVLRQRLPQRDLDGRALPRTGTGRLVPEPPGRTALHPLAALPGRPGNPDRYLEHDRPVRHRLGHLYGRRCFRTGRLYRHPRTARQLPRSGTALRNTATGYLRGRRRRCRARYRARDAGGVYRTRGHENARADYPDWRRMPVCSRALQEGEARIGAARAYLLEILEETCSRAPRDKAIDFTGRARVRLGATNAIQGAIETADWVYKNAGVDAIFPGSPYERRFRDIHTLSQQIQSRDLPLRIRRPHLSRQPTRRILLGS